MQEHDAFMAWHEQQEAEAEEQGRNSSQEAQDGPRRRRRRMRLEGGAAGGSGSSDGGSSGGSELEAAAGRRARPRALQPAAARRRRQCCRPPGARSRAPLPRHRRRRRYRVPRLLLLQASSGLSLHSVAAAVALGLAGIPWRAPGGGAAQPPQPPQQPQEQQQPQQGQQEQQEQELPPLQQQQQPQPQQEQEQGQPGPRAFLVDVAGVWDDARLEERLAAGLLGVSGSALTDVTDMLTGHLKLLGAAVRGPLVILLANCDAALAVEGGAGLFEVLRKLLALLPRAAVLVSSSAEPRQVLDDCIGVLPVLGGAPERDSHRLPGGGELRCTLLRLAAGGGRGGGLGLRIV
ncbi:MAG: hypothetical protein J3K34DRAFT_180151 [Monoraphidium minutum]|nr:MAG: hypothetical protein J3K34DRAFT_180151 [Monoraphidium minutum]